MRLAAGCSNGEVYRKGNIYAAGCSTEKTRDDQAKRSGNLREAGTGSAIVEHKILK